ncbi:MAG: hypothetical protein ACKKL6_00480 [Candidatus Komeilibacteria bacterium]
MLKNNILNTIKYFDIFEYPLTAWECYHWLYGGEKTTFEDIKRELETLIENKEVETLDGFYFLPGKDKHVETRQRRYLIAQLKYNIALRAVKMIRALPFIRYVAICNSLAYNNAADSSDIDLFIIAKKGKLWRARFVVATIMQLLHRRPNSKTSKDKICLSFLVSDDNLNLQSLAVDDDIYLKYWITQLVPLYDPDNLQTKLIKANSWIDKDLPNHLEYKTNRFRLVTDTKTSKFFKKLLEIKFGLNFLESLLRRLQFAILSNDLKTIANKDTRVVMTDQILKFHSLDRREEYRDKFKERINE